jgi:hypothetical protein
MDEEKPRKDFEEYTEELREKQRNLVFPQTMKNSRSVDWFLWHGVENPTLVQRIAAWLFGGTFIFAGLIFLDLTVEKMRWFIYHAVLFLGVGIKIFSNGFPKHKRPPSDS